MPTGKDIQITIRSIIDEARSTARELLNEMESQDLSVERYLMKAKKLARLQRDSDAQK
ncbi:hypothetical protein [Nostoc sp.]|uniref:hypothetical protein n=1 Tax=Nostoc sp. TaxID=1180 RepID=UPI002FF59C9E